MSSFSTLPEHFTENQFIFNLVVRCRCWFGLVGDHGNWLRSDTFQGRDRTDHTVTKANHSIYVKVATQMHREKRHCFIQWSFECIFIAEASGAIYSLEQYGTLIYTGNWKSHTYSPHTHLHAAEINHHGNCGASSDPGMVHNVDAQRSATEARQLHFLCFQRVALANIRERMLLRVWHRTATKISAGPSWHRLGMPWE